MLEIGVTKGFICHKSGWNVKEKVNFARSWGKFRFAKKTGAIAKIFLSYIQKQGKYTLVIKHVAEISKHKADNIGLAPKETE